jgi:hypothetical protein
MDLRGRDRTNYQLRNHVASVGAGAIGAASRSMCRAGRVRTPRRLQASGRKEKTMNPPPFTSKAPSVSNGNSDDCVDYGGTGWRVFGEEGRRLAQRCGCRLVRSQRIAGASGANAPSHPRPGPPITAAGNQRERILVALQAAGTRGVLNTELYKICLRPPSRICELRKMGYEIQTRREGESVFRFILRREPDHVRPLPTMMHCATQQNLPLAPAPEGS